MENARIEKWMWLVEWSCCNPKHLRLILKDTKITFQLIGKSLTGDLDDRGKTDHQLMFLHLANCSLFIEFSLPEKNPLIILRAVISFCNQLLRG